MRDAAHTATSARNSPYHRLAGTLVATTADYVGGRMERTVEGPGSHAVLVIANGLVTHVQPGCGAMLGQADEDLVGQPIGRLLHEPIEVDELRRSGRTRKPVTALGSDGRTRALWADIDVVTSHEETLVFVALSSSLRVPRTERQDQFERLVEAAPDPILIVDALGRIILVNAQVERVFGQRATDLIGQPVEMLVPERFRRAHTAHRHGYFAAPHTRQMGERGVSLFGRRKDGSEFPAEISLSVMHTDDGPVAITIVRDISDRQRAEDERAKLLRAQEALRVRDDFLALASHELRTPLTGLAMQLELTARLAERIPDRPLADRLLTKLGTCVRSASRLNRLVDELLDITRITAGRLSIERERLDLCAVVRDVVSLFGGETEQAGIRVELRLPDEPVWGCWDPLRLEQLVSNLLSNAIKYGLRQPIEISISAGPAEVRLAVRDHGVGIDSADQTRVFERFERAESARRQAGFGLGLWIARQLADAHGGRLDIASAVGAGSTFTATLPRGFEPTPESAH